LLFRYLFPTLVPRPGLWRVATATAPPLLLRGLHGGRLAWACGAAPKRSFSGLSGTDSSNRVGSWCAVFINLARRADRRAKLARTLAAGNSTLLAKLQRIEAFDGRNVNLDDSSLLSVVSKASLEQARRAKAMGAVTIVHREKQLVRFHNHLTEGGIACAMSHRAALEAVAFHPTADFGLILEDYICGVLPHVHESINCLVQRLPANWDAVFLGYHGGALAGDDNGIAEEHERAKLELHIDQMRGPTDGFHGAVDGKFEVGGIHDPPVLRMLTPLYGLYAWIVRKEAAQAALSAAFPIDGQVDHALSHWLLRERGRCFKVSPRHLLFFSPKSEDSLDSDIQSMTSLDGLLEDPEVFERYLHFVQGEDAHSA